jgi:hypothetical protein
MVKIKIKNILVWYITADFINFDLIIFMFADALFNIKSQNLFSDLTLKLLFCDKVEMHDSILDFFSSIWI